VSARNHFIFFILGQIDEERKGGKRGDLDGWMQPVYNFHQGRGERDWSVQLVTLVTPHRRKLGGRKKGMIPLVALRVLHQMTSLEKKKKKKRKT